MVNETVEFLKDPAKKLIEAPRAGQILMGQQVATTIDKGGVAFIEAPVGTGKSYAYLVPAALSKGRTVIATAKKSLQDQLMDDDIPKVLRSVGKKVSFTVLKGAANYFCQQRADGLKNATARAEIEEWQMCLGDIASGGDVAGYPGGYPDYWPDVNVEECSGALCKHYQRCGYAKTVKAAQESNLVVTNHHVLAHSLYRGSTLFGEYNTLVLDEAHQFPEALRSAQTRELSKAGLAALHRRYEAAGGSRPEEALEEAWDAIEGALTGIDGVFPPEFVGSEVAALQHLLGQMAQEVKAKDATTDSHGYSVEVIKASELAGRAKTKSFTDALLRVSNALELLTDTSRSKDIINAVSTSDFKSATREVRIQPVTPGNAVRAPLALIPAVIMTSGTLSVGGTFAHIAMESGLPAPSEEDEKSKAVGLRCASPFNYRRQAVLYTPRHLPKPVSGRSEERYAWVNAVGLEIKRLIEAANGNTLILFSANADLNDIHRKLSDLGVKQPIIAQKPGRAADAEAAYRATPNSVLLGSKSFFEGLNIKGDKLWSVIIPRLPFPVPSDPVIATKTQRLEARYLAMGMDPGGARAQTFKKVSVPPMLFDTMQGAGRLIRTVTDRGLLSILDPRIWTGSGSRLPKPNQLEYNGYGETVVNALGFPRRTSKFEDVDTYFRSLRT